MTRPNPLIVTLALIACLAAPAGADCVDYQNYLHRSSLTTYPDLFGKDAVLVGDVLVTGCWAGLVTIAMHDGRPGEILDSLDTQGGAHLVTAAGEFVYTVNGGGLLTVLRVDAEGVLTTLGSVDTPGYSHGLCTADPDLALIAGSAGLALVDVSDPAAPALRSVIACGVGRDVAADGVVAHVAVDGFGVRSFDVGHPDAPFLLAHVPLDGGASDLDLEDDRLAVTYGYGSLHVLDVSEPWAPVLLNALDVPADLVVMGDERVYAVWGGSFAVIALDPSGGGQVLGRLMLDTGRDEMIRLGDRMLIVGMHTMEVVDFSVPDSFEPATVPLDDRPGDFVVSDDRLVTIAGDGCLRVYERDGSNPPSLLGEVSLGPPLRELVVAGDWAFVGDDSSAPGIAGVDLSDPTSPVVAWTMHLDRNHRNLAIDGDLLAVLCQGGSGLLVIDVSDPAVPVRRGQMGIDGYDLALVGDVAYVAANLSGVAVVSLADPDHPQLVRTVQTTGAPRSVAVAGDLMVTLDYGFGISTLSLADPLWPVLLGAANAPTGSEGEVVILDQHAYVSSWWMGFLAYDLSDPAAPDLMGGVHGTHSRIEVFGDRLFTTSEGTDLLVFPPQCDVLTAVDPATGDGEPGPAVGPGSLHIVDVAPNPCNPATSVRLRLDAAGAVRCRVADLRGRWVATLADGWRTAGEHVLRWNGRDAAGRHVAAGTYLIRVEAGAEVRTARVSLVK